MKQADPFVVHTAADSYTRDLRDPALVPMLGVDDDRLSALVSLMGAPARRTEPDVSGTLVVAPPGSVATAVGQALADRVGGSFVTLSDGGLGRILDTRLETTQVVFVALHGEIDLGVVTESLEAVSADRHATIGFVLGPDLTELSWLLAKGLSCHLRKPPERNRLTVVPWLSHPATANADAAPEWVLGVRASREVLEPMLNEQYTGLVSFASAGREHALILRDTVICGDHAGHRGFARGAAKPSCATSDRCFRDGVRARDVIKAARVQADIVFANSCMAWRPGTGLVAAEYQLAGAFQSGIPAAYIGAVHQMLPNLTINNLVDTAAAAGLDAGRICATVDNHLRDTGRELPYFAVLGLPWVTAGGGAEPPSTIDIKPSADAHDSVREMRPRLQRLGRTVRALRDFGPTGFMPPDGIATMEAEILDLARTLKKTALGAEPAEKVSGPLHRLGTMIADAELNAVADFHEFGKMSHSALNEMWEGILETTVRPIDAACPYCARKLAELVARHPVYEQVGRRALICTVCGPIADSPPEPVLGEVLIDCPSIWKRPGTVTVDVLMTPAASVSQEIVVAGAIHLSGAANFGMVFPDARRIALQPGSPTRMRADATLSAEAFAHHEHFVRFVAVAEGLVHYASRPVAVV